MPTILSRESSENQGIMLYMNFNERVQSALEKVSSRGGKIVQTTHAIGPHGLRAIICDSEGNRIVLHSETDN